MLSIASHLSTEGRAAVGADAIQHPDRGCGNLLVDDVVSQRCCDTWLRMLTATANAERAPPTTNLISRMVNRKKNSAACATTATYSSLGCRLTVRLDNRPNPEQFNAGFCRAMLCKGGLCRHVVFVCVSVRLSVVDSVEANKRIFKIFSPSVATLF